MMLRVATVLSAREWEARFVAAARDSAAVKLVLRAYLPDEVASRADSIDVVIAGAETPWVTPTRVAAWRRLGIRVVGVHPRLDRPAADRMTAGGADLILVDDLDCEQMVREIRLLEADGPGRRERTGRLIAVTGTRGGPGRTEMATALAWTAAACGPTVLLDADLSGPSLAVRLGLTPRPDLADCVDRTLDVGGEISSATQRFGRLMVIPGALRPTGVRQESALDVAESLTTEATVVVDTGPWASSTILRSADKVVFVLDAAPVGIVRAARVFDAWEEPPPDLVVNKVGSGRRHDVVRTVRRWSGLEPAAVVPYRRSTYSAAVTGSPPDKRLVKDIAHLVEGGGSGR